MTASHSAESRDQIPAHIMVIGREQIRERRYKNLADPLEDMPDVDFQRGTKSSQFNQCTVQGNLGPNRLLVLLDSVRIGQPSAGSYPAAENLAPCRGGEAQSLGLVLIDCFIQRCVPAFDTGPKCFGVSRHIGRDDSGLSESQPGQILVSQGCCTAFVIHDIHDQAFRNYRSR